jgi:hypothetical protein
MNDGARTCCSLFPSLSVSLRKDDLFAEHMEIELSMVAAEGIAKEKKKK